MEGQREHTDVHSHCLSTPALRSMCLHLFLSSRFLFPVLTILLYRHAPSLRDSSPHGPIQPTVSAEQIWHEACGVSTVRSLLLWRRWTYCSWGREMRSVFVSFLPLVFCALITLRVMLGQIKKGLANFYSFLSTRKSKRSNLYGAPAFLQLPSTFTGVCFVCPRRSLVSYMKNKIHNVGSRLWFHCFTEQGSQFTLVDIILKK